MKRRVRPEERAEWQAAMHNVRRISANGSAEPEPTNVPASPICLAPLPAAAPQRKHLSTLPAAALDRDTARRLANGTARIEASLDLHGMKETDAHAALLSFIEGAVQEQLRIVLVVTGKGEKGQGILKRNLPSWLDGPQLRMRVMSYGEALPRHGGTGALYIVLRRTRRSVAS